MKALSLSKLLAVVVMVGGSLANAQASNPAGGAPAAGGGAAVVQRTELDATVDYCEKRLGKSGQELEKCVRENRGGGLGAAFGSCESAAKQFAEASSKFGTACSEGRTALNSYSRSIGADPSDDGSSSKGRPALTGCEANVVRCMECAASDGDTITGGLRCPKFSSESDDDDLNELSTATLNSITTGAFGMSGAAAKSGSLSAAEKADILSCIPDSAEGLSDLRKNVNDARKDVRESERSITEAQRELAEIQTDYQEEQNRLRDEGEAIQEKARARVDNIKAKLEEANAKLAETVQKIQIEYDKVEADVRRLNQKKVEATLAFSDAMSQLDASCHASALKQVDDYRKAQMAAISAKSYTVGGFADVLGQTGTNMKQKYQKMAEQFYQDCQQDQSFRDAKASADRRRQFAIDSAEQEVTTLRQQQQRMQEQVQQLQGTEKNRIAQLALQDMQREQDNMTKALASLDKKAQLAAQKVQQKQMQKQMDINRLARNASEDRAEYDRELETQRLIRTHAKSGGKEGSTGRAISAFQDKVRYARDAALACCKDDSNKSNCVSACSFLKGEGAPEALLTNCMNAAKSGTAPKFSREGAK